MICHVAEAVRGRLRRPCLVLRASRNHHDVARPQIRCSLPTRNSILPLSIHTIPARQRFPMLGRTIMGIPPLLDVPITAIFRSRIEDGCSVHRSCR
jgi:hypothetical protein